MHLTRNQATDLVTGLIAEVGGVSGVETVVFPPFTLLGPVSELVKNSGIGLGAQNMFWEKEGAYTGEVSPAMIVDAGCRYVILGHSERRHFFGESDEMVNRKLRRALEFELTPIVCLGEQLEDRKSGRQFRVVQAQVRQSLAGIEPAQAQTMVVAYEPVWAIGTGETATPDQAQEMHARLRQWLGELWDEATASKIRIQYGGSVKPANAGELLSRNDIDGALVGGASLKADAFAAIVRLGESE
jgi:triosephosphate isomerase